MTPLVIIEEGPLQPLAVTCIKTVPENPFAHVITPAEVIEPAEGLLNDQLNPVLFVAVVAYVIASDDRRSFSLTVGVRVHLHGGTLLHGEVAADDCVHDHADVLTGGES